MGLKDQYVEIGGHARGVRGGGKAELGVVDEALNDADEHEAQVLSALQSL